MTAAAAQFGAILVRELTSLKQEIEAYPNDADVWKLVPGIANSAGTLTLHLAGNLQHFIGTILGASGYRRNRDAEFATRSLPRSDLIREVDAAIASVQQTFRGLGPSDLASEYPEPVAKVQLNTNDFLIHLASHLAYHLGQVDYHRRIVTGNPATVGTVAPGKLASARPVE